MAKNIIFDTDLGGDCDDVVALDLLLSAHKAGECRLLGVCSSFRCLSAPGCIHEILRQHGCADIPVAHIGDVSQALPHEDLYAPAVVKKFGRADTADYATTPEAVRLLRQLLAAHDHVTIVVTGPFTNISGLMASEADEFSPLNGMELMRAAVDELVLTGCSFCHENGRNPEPDFILEDGTLKPICEWNVYCDIPAARHILCSCPVPVACCPIELGYNILSGGEMCAHGRGETPDSLCMLVHGAGETGQHSWDPIAALYALCGTRPRFYRTVKGRIILDGDGVAHFDSQHGGGHVIIHRAMSADALGEDINGRIRRLL